jgi:hypothetical protein
MECEDLLDHTADLAYGGLVVIAFVIGIGTIALFASRLQSIAVIWRAVGAVLLIVIWAFLLVLFFQAVRPDTCRVV